MVIPPKYAVSKAVETIKKNTCRSLSRKFAFLKEVYWDRKGIWGKGYFVSTVGINEEVICKYVQSQAEEETGQVPFEFLMYPICEGVGIDKLTPKIMNGKIEIVLFFLKVMLRLAWYAALVKRGYFPP